MSRLASGGERFPLGFPRVSGDEPDYTLQTVVSGECFPRVSGDEPQAIASAATHGVFSPRERG